MDVRRGAGSGLALLDFETFCKKGCFLSFQWEKINFTTFGPLLKKFRQNPLVPPPGKNPSDAHHLTYINLTANSYN